LNREGRFAGGSRLFGAGKKVEVGQGADPGKPAPNNPAPNKLDPGDLTSLAWGTLSPRLKAKLSTTSKALPKFMETARQAVFSGENRPSNEYNIPKSELAGFLRSCRQIFWAMALFSGVSNILMLTGSFFMLQVYDRVLPSRSVPTLIGLLVLATILYAFQGGLDLVRSRISARIGRFLDETLSLRVYDAVVRLPL
jgi:ABC-type bacteriocin/lantibiotic exporter with double-glycine peptidase domain